MSIVETRLTQSQSQFGFSTCIVRSILQNDGNVNEYDKLPLRERLTKAERLTRELSEHLEQGFLPKLETLRKVTRQSSMEDTTDKTVRDTAKTVRASEEYTSELYQKLADCLQSIAGEVQTMIHGE